MASSWVVGVGGEGEQESKRARVQESRREVEKESRRARVEPEQ